MSDADGEEHAAPVPDDPDPTGADEERHRLRLQELQARVEHLRCRPAVRLALAAQVRLTGQPPLRPPDDRPPPGAQPAPDGPPGAVAAWRRAVTHEQLLRDVGREQAALDRLTGDPLLRLATRVPVRRHQGRARRPPAVGPDVAAPVIAITTAAPPARAETWGDWHLASALAEALTRAGAPSQVQSAAGAASAGGAAPVHLVVRGLRRRTRTTERCQVLWVISHPEQVTTEECEDADLVLVASTTFADHLRQRTSTPVAVLAQATDARRFRPMAPSAQLRHELLIVANARGVLRPAVAAALEAGLRPAIIGTGWDGLVDPDLVVADHVPNTELAHVYASSDLVLADHWGTMRAWGFVANRLLDVAACGIPVVSDELPGLDDLLPGAIPTWSDADDLARLVDDRRRRPEVWTTRAATARRLVLARHTTDHRARELLAHLASLLGSDATMGTSTTAPGGSTDP